MPPMFPRILTLITILLVVTIASTANAKPDAHRPPNIILFLADDLGETTDLASANPEKAEELRKQLHDWRLSVDAQMPVPNPDHDAEAARGNVKKEKKDRKA